MTARCFALIPAGGIGSRAGAAVPKQYLPLAGKPMIAHALAAFAALPVIERIAVVIAADDTHFETIEFDREVAARLDVLRVGGASRDATVANGLEALRATIADDDWVLVHDAARCGITSLLIASLIASLMQRARDDVAGGLLAVPLDDTVKREVAGGAGAGAIVSQTVDRHGLWRAQTPQMFRRRMLGEAIAAARARGVATTDEASAIEAAGHRVLLVPGSPRNFKVTTAEDLAMMDALLRHGPHHRATE